MPKPDDLLRLEDASKLGFPHIRMTASGLKPSGDALPITSRPDHPKDTGASDRAEARQMADYSGLVRAQARSREAEQRNTADNRAG
jgi:hypothetical protein